ncbi:diguanylate cyclase [Fulvimarina sp. MAC3]|uniref:GGDEF domain-containing protein n=1 Tax=Fulvimarina sp. MAC3 TaxID=3148887 RepID=UPI0031FDEFF2
MREPELLLGMVNSLGVFALVTLAYAYILRGTDKGAVRSILIGIMFGTGGCLAIANTTEFVPGLFIDPRAVMLVLAAPFGGTLSAVIAAAMTVALRLYDGGVGAPAGVANIVSTAILGIAFTKLAIGKTLPISFAKLLILGFLSNIPLLFILIVPVPNAAQMFLSAIGPLTVADTLGVLILGKVLNDACKTHSSRQRLAVEAHTDPLTKLPNRRDFERRIGPVFERARRDGTPVSLLVIDVDHFKTINDTLGHEAGDVVLVWIADIIRQHMRRSDLITRYGGEEIVVAMPGADAAGAASTAERIRGVVEEKGPLDPDTGHRVTISIGVATEIENFADLFNAADKALYAAKRQGRNRVVIGAGPERVAA